MGTRILGLVVVIVAMVACSSSGEGTTTASDGSTPATGGAVGGATNGGTSGVRSGGTSGSGGHSPTGGAPGTQCRTTADCPPLGCFMCSVSCVNGRCVSTVYGGSGGLSGSGGVSGSGGIGVGGIVGSGGLCGCQCGPSAVRLLVSAQGAGGGNGVIGSLTVQGTVLDMKCVRSGCQFVCNSTQSGDSTISGLGEGDYALSVAAPGYQTQTVTVHVSKSCGCCGCCLFSTPNSVELVPDGSPITGCCADLMTDPNNCGTCGKQCDAGTWCAGGACTPPLSPCVSASSGFTNCAGYCASVGKTCAPACGPSGTESLHWWGQGSTNCGDNVYSSNGTCSDNLLASGARCCCG